MVKVLAGHGDELALFFAIDGEMRGLDVASGARFDFDETERVSFPGDEVDFSAAPRRTEISGDDDIAELTEMEVGDFLAALPGLLVLRDIFGRVGASDEPIESLQGDFGEEAWHG